MVLLSLPSSLPISLPLTSDKAGRKDLPLWQVIGKVARVNKIHNNEHRVIWEIPWISTVLLGQILFPHTSAFCQWLSTASIMERKRAFAIHSGMFHPLPACSLGDVTLQPPGSPHTSWKHFLLPLLCSSELSLEHLACCLLLELWGVPGGSWWVFWRAFCVRGFVCVCVCVCVCVQRYICGATSNSKERFRMKSNNLPLPPSPVLKQHFWQFSSQTINTMLDSLT